MGERNWAIDWRLTSPLNLTAKTLLRVDGYRIVKLGDRMLEIPTNGKKGESAIDLTETGVIYQALRRAG